MNDELDNAATNEIGGAKFDLPLFSYSEDELINGAGRNSAGFRPIDTRNMPEARLEEVYNALWSAIANRSSMGVQRHHFFGYDIHAIIGSLQYLYTVNYYDEFNPDVGAEIHYASQNYFGTPPEDVVGSIEGVSSGQSQSPRTSQAPENYEAWYAPIEPGQTPALDQYGRLLTQMRRNGPRPSDLADKSFDELILMVAKIEKWRSYLSISEQIPASLEAAGGILVSARFVEKSVRFTGPLGTLIVVGDTALSLIEEKYEEEIMRRINYDPDDEVDANFYESRKKALNIEIDLGDL